MVLTYSADRTTRSCILCLYSRVIVPFQLADIQHFSTAEQRELTQTFTFITSMGVVASFLVGWLMDQVGLEICTALTLVLGQTRSIALVWLADRKAFLVASFVCYSFFRSFLFPVYIASLTTHLGYKYFGLLNGIGFATAGVAQIFMGHLVRAVQGDCHLNSHVNDPAFAPPCNHGQWETLHFVELLILTLLLTAPVLDFLEKVVRKRRIREVLGSIRSLSSHSYNQGYGSFASVPSGETEGTEHVWQ